MVRDIIVQLGIADAADRKLTLSGRSVEQHRAEIRELLGFREATGANSEALAEGLQQQTVAIGV
jgi:hypothetical protein